MERSILVFILFVLFSFGATSLCYANAAEPPTIFIIVPDAPGDLEITIYPENVKAKRIDKGTESDFIFLRYGDHLNTTGLHYLKVTTGNVTFEITLDIPLNTFNNIFTLDLSGQTLTVGKSWSRSIERAINLTILRVVITFIIEGGLFFLFGYRRKRSWLIFLAVNLFTQVLLNIWINMNFNPLDSYIFSGLLFLEMIILVIELVAFLLFVQEHGRMRTALFVIIANVLSFIAGGYLITLLPV